MTFTEGGRNMADIGYTQEQVYLEFSDKVMRYIRSKISNQQDAEDLQSQVFIKVYQNFDKFNESKASMSTWIYNITRNTVIDFFRTRHVHSDIDDEVAEVAGEDDSFNDILNQETLGELAAALQKIPQRERDLLILHYYSGLTLKEVAMRMGMSYSNCKLIHNKALGYMRRHMQID
jgi:RNA polymerase sigma-70 factor (ECF subfamily)